MTLLTCVCSRHFAKTHAEFAAYDSHYHYAATPIVLVRLARVAVLALHRGLTGATFRWPSSSSAVSLLATTSAASISPSSEKRWPLSAAFVGIPKSRRVLVAVCSDLRSHMQEPEAAKHRDHEAKAATSSSDDGKDG